MSTVQPINDGAYVPRTVLAMAEENIDRAQDVIVLVKEKDGNRRIFWTRSNVSDLCELKASLDKAIMESLK